MYLILEKYDVHQDMYSQHRQLSGQGLQAFWGCMVGYSWKKVSHHLITILICLTSGSRMEQLRRQLDCSCRYFMRSVKRPQEYFDNSIVLIWVVLLINVLDLFINNVGWDILIESIICYKFWEKKHFCETHDHGDNLCGEPSLVANFLQLMFCIKSFN